MLQELILILTQFGGGPGDPANNVVRFLLAAFFWGVLLFVSWRLWKSSRDHRHRFFSIAAAIGLTRELFMFGAEYGSFRGFFPFSAIFRYYPPIEHSIDLLSNLLLGYAFVRFYFNFERFSYIFLITSTALSIGAYIVIAPLWIQFLDTQMQAAQTGSAYMGSHFHDFPGDFVYRLFGVLIIIPILASFLYARNRQIRIPWLAFIAFFCFFLDHALQAVNDLVDDRYSPVFAPLRHCLHTGAIIQLVGVYWWEVTWQLKSRNQFLQIMLDTIPDLIYYKNSENVYQGCNKKFCESFAGGDKSRVIAGIDLDIYSDRQLAVHNRDEDRKLMAENVSAISEQTYAFENGIQDVFETIKSPYVDLAGNVAGLISISRNITRRKHVEEELKHKNAELERFMYTLSHDLKTPLVTITYFLGSLEHNIKTAATLRIHDDLGFLRSAAAKMKLLLEELLELSRVGRVISCLESVGYQEIITEVLALCAGHIQVKNIQVLCDESELILHGDRNRLIEIWQNLVENAAKYMGSSAEPLIHIGMEQRQDGIVFFVRDNGIGIDTKFHENIFGLFNKLDASSEGSGLGLALVRRIVEMYSGRIWVESDGINCGSCFYFTLPDAVKVI